jgi:preprotein translocase subunit YajC
LWVIRSDYNVLFITPYGQKMTGEGFSTTFLATLLLLAFFLLFSRQQRRPDSEDAKLEMNVG